MTIQVRQTTYRGQPGWLICGRRTGQVGGWGVSIFTRSESSARHIAAKVRAGIQINAADFDHSATL